MKNEEVIDATQNLPANIEKVVATRSEISEKLADIKEKMDKLNAVKKKLGEYLDENNRMLKIIHKENGDFEVAGLTVKLSTSWSTEVVDESKLPGSCFKIKKEVIKAKVKELILEGELPREVAYQKKSESISIK